MSAVAGSETPQESGQLMSKKQQRSNGMKYKLHYSACYCDVEDGTSALVWFSTVFSRLSSRYEF